MKYDEQTGAKAVSKWLGMNTETLRTWIRRTEINAGTREGKTSSPLGEVRELKWFQKTSTPKSCVG